MLSTKSLTHLSYLLDTPAACCSSWNAGCYTTDSAENYQHGCSKCGGGLSKCNPCSSFCSGLSRISNPESEECRQCCIRETHATPWNCPLEPANCCTSWSADCYMTSTIDNFQHGCVACSSSPCSDACGNYEGTTADSEACRQCCVAATHATPWNCELVTTAAPTTTPEPETCSDKIQNQNEKGIDCGGVCSNECVGKVCKDKIPRRQCFLKMMKGRCKRASVRAKCALSCRSCCGNLWGLKKCNRIKGHCQRNKRVSRKCRKSCKKC